MIRTILASVAIAALLGACGSDNVQNKAFGLAPVQTQNDYRVIRSGATGASHGFMLLFIPIMWPSYADAETDLLDSNTNGHVGPSGRPVALANVVRDHSFFTLLLFSIPGKHITADVIEFVDPRQGTGVQQPETLPPSYQNAIPMPLPEAH